MTVDYGPRSALVVVDTQNDFADPDGSLYVRDSAAAIVAMNEAIAAAKEAGCRVVYTQDWHPPSTPHFAKDGGKWPVHCVAGTWGAELHPDLVVDGERVRKGSGGEDGYSGFTMLHPTSGETYATELHDLLQAHDVERVVVVGLATDYCVKETALDAVRLGYETLVLVDGVRPVELEPGDGRKAVDAMTSAGVTLG